MNLSEKKPVGENISAEQMDEKKLVTYPTDAFFSRDYLEDEKRLLWPKIWQMVEREEDLPNPGDWMGNRSGAALLCALGEM